MSDSDSSDDEEELLRELQQDVARAPRIYEAHVRLIEALRASGELGGVRKAREAMNAIFPLTEQMWAAWIQVPPHMLNKML